MGGQSDHGSSTWHKRTFEHCLMERWSAQGAPRQRHLKPGCSVRSRSEGVPCPEPRSDRLIVIHTYHSQALRKPSPASVP